MFFFFLSFSVLRRRFQVAGGAESRRKGTEEAGRAGAGGAGGSECRDAATLAGKLAAQAFALGAQFSRPPHLKSFIWITVLI